MKKIEPQSVGDVLRLTIEECNMAARFEELRAIDIWRPIVGPQLAKLCGKPTVYNGIMRVAVPGASLRQELTMNRSTLVRLINAELGKTIIKDIRFI